MHRRSQKVTAVRRIDLKLALAQSQLEKVGEFGRAHEILSVRQKMSKTVKAWEIKR